MFPHPIASNRVRGGRNRPRETTSKRRRCLDITPTTVEINVLRGVIHAQTWTLLTSEQQARAGEIRTETKARRRDRREAERLVRERRESRRRQR